MEMLALMGAPKVVADYNSDERSSPLFSVSPVTNVFTNDLNQPGVLFNGPVSMDATGWFQYAFGLTINAGVFSLKDDTYDRSVVGFRIVTKSGYRGEASGTPYLYAFASEKPSTGNSSIGCPIPYTPHLTDDNGQYWEIVIDWKTGTLWIYIDGGFVSKIKWPAPQGIDSAYPIFFRLYADQINMPYANTPVVGHVRDLYMGGLGVGEVFEPLGDLKVEQLLTTSHTLNFNITPTDMNNWGSLATVASTLDTAGTKLFTQSLANPAALKTADYIYAIHQKVTGTGYVEAGSNGAKIAGDIKPRLLPDVRIVKINPADIGNDLTLSFKIDP
jgi:hypothetical protein